MADEIELKLLVEPKDLQRLQRHPVLRSLAQGRAQTNNLKNTYFDSAQRDLQRAGRALRIREIGTRRLQTLKTPPPAGRRVNGAQHFLEFETETGKERPDLSLISDAAIRDELLQSGVEERLEPLFITDFKRRKLPVRMADSEIEVSFDQGLIAAGGREAALSEVELELQSGQPQRLYELALLLSEKVAFRLGKQTKAARGFALLEPKEPEAVYAAKLELPKGLGAGEALRVCSLACLAQLRANEDAVFHAEDPEGVHQMRVAVRRLRALLSCYKPLLQGDAAAYLAGELRWLQNELGHARDWDVFVEETLTPLERRIPGDEGLEELVAHAREHRENAYHQAHDCLADPRYTRLLLRLHLWLADDSWLLPAEAGKAQAADVPAERFAAIVLARRSKKLKKLANRRKKLSEPQLHEVRIAAKKLRYASEFFGSLFSRKSSKAYRGLVQGLQDTLGSLNDAVVGHRLLDEIEETLGKERAARLAAPIGMVMGWQAARTEADLKRFEGAWKTFDKSKPFWG